jgi:alpha-ketoglutarate-dependent taurine dioxygenase
MDDALGPEIPDFAEGQIVPGRSLPLVLRPKNDGADLVQLASEHRDLIRQRLSIHGGILFRDFPDVSIDTFNKAIAALAGDPLEYHEQTSPRHKVSGNIYISTDFPAKQSIFVHNEQSYCLTWPLRIFFHCVTPAAAGGATPLADCRRIYQRISAATRAKLEDRGYCYARHFGGGLGLNWEDAFQTDDRALVEKYCLANGIDFAWAPDGSLTTRQVRPVTTPHPETGEPVWFNHLTFFNIATLGQATAEALLSLGRDQLPNNTYYGDGADIEPGILAELEAAYRAETVAFPWQAGDILMLDNMMVAHGREPYTPPRQVVVGMAEPYSRSL